jgi:hypothetical protein
MSEKENAVKFTISMELELRDWVDAKVIEMNRKDRRFKTSRSAIIADAVQSLKESEESSQNSSSKASNISPDISAKIVKPYKRAAGGRSIAKKKICLPAG